jgi:hypothetical protein
MTLVTSAPSQNGVAKKTQPGPVKVHVTLTSKGKGILMNPMTRDTLEELAGIKSKAASDKDTPTEDRAAKRVIRSEEDEKIGIPIEYIFASLIHAGRYVKNGKDKISTATTTTLYEFLDIPESFLPFTNQDEPMVTDMRRGVLNNAGKSVAVAIIRPRFKQWELSFTVEVDTAVMGIDVVRQLFVAAGSKIGVGDFRPSKRGPFGMWKVTEWKVLED